jgi:tetratricopeptide (TPR) repeat protein
MNKGKYQDAITLFKNKLEKKPLKSSNYYALGYCYYMLGYIQHAINNFEKAVELKINRINVFYLLAILYAEENKFDKAFGYIEKGEEIQNKTGFLNKLTQYERNDFWGWIYYLKGELDKSLEFYNVAIPKWMKKIKEGGEKIKEYYASPCYRLGIIYLIKSDLESAKKMFSLSIKASPESIFANKSQEELEKLTKDTEAESLKNQV